MRFCTTQPPLPAKQTTKAEARNPRDHPAKAPADAVAPKG